MRGSEIGYVPKRKRCPQPSLDEYNDWSLESTQNGEVIEGRKIQAVPLNGRSYTDLLSLQGAPHGAIAGAEPSTSLNEPYDDRT